MNYLIGNCYNYTHFANKERLYNLPGVALLVTRKADTLIQTVQLSELSKFKNSFVSFLKKYNKLNMFKRYNLINFDIYIHLWEYYQTQDNADIHHSQKFPRAWLESLPFIPHQSFPHLMLRQSDLLSVTINWLSPSRILSKWNYTVCAILPCFCHLA